MIIICARNAEHEDLISMFTGIVETMGKILSITAMDTTSTGGSGYSVVVDCADILSDVILGDSIAVNGICLTVTELIMHDSLAASVKFQISPETLRLTNLGDLAVGDAVNLERAMKVGQRFSGHMVQGHVDTTVTITSIKQDPPNSIIYTFTAADSQFLPYIVHKGYVCLDGTSLTVVSVDYATLSFKIMLIQYTQLHVIMPSKQVGHRVNLEVDQVGKYVESVVVGMMSSNPVIEGLIENIVRKVMNKSSE